MFSATMIGLLAALSIATWTYTKVMRQTGNNNQQSLTVAGLAGAISFVIVLTIVWTIDSMLGN